MSSFINGKQFLTIFIPVVILISSVCVYYRKKKDAIPREWIKIGTVKNLIMYPLKSGKRIELSDVECTNVGLRQIYMEDNLFQLKDRFLIVYKDNEFRTARNYPKLILVSVSSHDKDHLKFNAPMMNTLLLKIPNESCKNEVRSIKFHDSEKIQIIDCGNEVAAWLSRYILDKESGLRLGYNDGSLRRDITEVHKKLIKYYRKLSNSSTGLYSDLASILLVNQKSVDDLNTRLDNSVTAHNFRPNIVVDDPNLKPYVEDNWDWIKIGNVIFRNVKECTRCIMTTIDPETGLRSSNREPLKTLEKYRRSNGPENGPIMGINLEVTKHGFISVGDSVMISLLN